MTVPSMQVSSLVQAQIIGHCSSSAPDRYGYLTGVCTGTSTAVLGSLRSTTPLDAPSSAIKDELESLRALIPEGLSFLGSYVVIEDESKDNFGSLHWCNNVAPLVNPQSSTSPAAVLAAVTPSGTKASIEWTLSTGHSQPAVRISPSTLEESWLENHFALLRYNTPVNILLYKGANGKDSSQEQYLRQVEKVLADLLSTNAAYLVEATGAGSVSEASPSSSSASNKKKGKGKKGPSDAGQPNAATVPSAFLISEGSACTATCEDISQVFEAVTVQPLILSSSTAHAGDPSPPPRVVCQPVAEPDIQVRSVTLNVDVLAYAPKSMLLADAIRDLLVTGVRRQLRHASMMDAIRSSSGQSSGFHFKVPGHATYVTVAYPLPRAGASSVEEESLQPRRKALHTALGLPLDRPLLRTSNAAELAAATDVAQDADGRLRNTHIGIPASGVKGGVQSLVQGDYVYHHYMQDRFDDKGWGCAYRSLQTLCSWFRLQHYTTVPVPSHKCALLQLATASRAAPCAVLRLAAPRPVPCCG
ncbi:hypothetical protein CYMTET_30883 [Cymbomonas tetramitiformis]|uniref:Ufm1-specific protease n=1 Tax=Cymbomonas tetramitiformis TaxID=36881 RepID=A0AAE0KTG3_9CHLO|nr:hypothetical protein CYMTET_30883 [Cymbomonas tetramitiformis]